MTRGLRVVALGGVLAVALGGGFVVAASEDDDNSSREGTDSSGIVDTVPDERAGSVAQLADCRDWRAADDGERRRLVEDIRSHVGLRDTPTPIDELSDETTAEVFDRNCNRSFASAFRLYKIYARAVAFNSLAD